MNNVVLNIAKVNKAWVSSEGNTEKFIGAVDALYDDDDFDIALSLPEMEAIVANGYLTYKDLAEYLFLMNKYNRALHIIYCNN